MAIYHRDWFVHTNARPKFRAGDKVFSVYTYYPSDDECIFTYVEGIIDDVLPNGLYRVSIVKSSRPNARDHIITFSVLKFIPPKLPIGRKVFFNGRPGVVIDTIPNLGFHLYRVKFNDESYFDVPRIALRTESEEKAFYKEVKESRKPYSPDIADDVYKFISIVGIDTFKKISFDSFKVGNVERFEAGIDYACSEYLLCFDPHISERIHKFGINKAERAVKEIVKKMFPGKNIEVCIDSVTPLRMIVTWKISGERLELVYWYRDENYKNFK